MKCKVTHRIDDAEGAVYENDIVQVIEWTDVSVANHDSYIVVFVVDDVGKHHTVGLTDLTEL